MEDGNGFQFLIGNVLAHVTNSQETGASAVFQFLIGNVLAKRPDVLAPTKLVFQFLIGNVLARSRSLVPPRLGPSFQFLIGNVLASLRLCAKWGIIWCFNSL